MDCRRLRRRSTHAASSGSAAASNARWLPLKAGTGEAQVRLTNKMVVVSAATGNGALEPVQTSPPLLCEVTPTV